MFDIFARLISSIATLLFPVFASHKALQSRDNAQLAPWLMYWVVLACVLLAESWVGWIVTWFPFYQWVRAGFLLYLVLPQTQGAVLIYQLYFEPFLVSHEREIEDFISSAHDRAKRVGWQYLTQLLEIFKEQVLGFPRQESARPPTPSAGSYAQALLARFNLPSATDMPSNTQGRNPSNDFYSLLATTLSQMSPSRGSKAVDQAEYLSSSGTLIPPSIKDREDRISFIEAQRQRIQVFLRALDHEENNLFTGGGAKAPHASAAQDAASDANITLPGALTPQESPILTGADLPQRKSEVDFEKVERHELHELAGKNGETSEGKSPSAGWSPWTFWGGRNTASSQRDDGSDTATKKEL